MPSVEPCRPKLVSSVSSNQLTGTIPTEIGSLWEMRLLQLGLNHFTGTLPMEFRSLWALQFLDVSENSLTGSPANALRASRRLNRLWLQNNNWTEVETFCSQTTYPELTLMNANSCEERNLYNCSCCTTCCDSPPV
eukprot:CAMPEP_0116548346 /NCGR_PEP_ID=MMETSP0397-20121206/4278_1 /TAXON_ID=216820 /ORGANISM="Cyclophora tenuis, Strain ECT3854" /LENGTH=135 /DNA_ID=CAMNT_0004072971 /DNA_START=141 /DNA_END=544 /DNA_ORIENTATION=+